VNIIVVTTFALLIAAAVRPFTVPAQNVLLLLFNFMLLCAACYALSAVDNAADDAEREAAMETATHIGFAAIGIVLLSVLLSIGAFALMVEMRALLLVDEDRLWEEDEDEELLGIGPGAMHAGDGTTAANASPGRRSVHFVEDVNSDGDPPSVTTSSNDAAAHADGPDAPSDDTARGPDVSVHVPGGSTPPPPEAKKTGGAAGILTKMLQPEPPKAGTEDDPWADL